MRRFLAALGMTLACAVASADVAVPKLEARVTDLTGTLTAEQRAGLEQRLAAFEQRKGSQIAVLLVPTTQPETIEQYSLRVVEAWQLGRKGVDDGVLLLIAKDDRALRIEVGYGLEGVLPDAIAKRIIAETITPHFRAGNFHGGIAAGVDQVVRVVDGEPLPAPREAWHEPDQGGDPAGLVVFAIFVLAMAARALGRWLSVFAASVTIGLVAGMMGGLALSSLVAGAVCGLFGFLLAMVLLANATRRGGWLSGGGGSGRFGGGGFSRGGGFSGGGGSFGGGGASGRW